MLIVINCTCIFSLAKLFTENNIYYEIMNLLIQIYVSVADQIIVFAMGDLDFVDFNVFMFRHHDDHSDDIIAIVDKGQTMEYLWKPTPT